MRYIIFDYKNIANIANSMAFIRDKAINVQSLKELE